MGAIDDLKQAIADLQAQETLVKDFVASILVRITDLEAAVEASKNVDPAIIQATADIRQEIEDLKNDIGAPEA